MLDTVVKIFVVVWCLILWLVYLSLVTSTISCALLSSVYECQRMECAFRFPVRTVCSRFVICCMQSCMSVSTVL